MAAHPMIRLTRTLGSIVIRNATPQERKELLLILSEVKAAQDDPNHMLDGPGDESLEACFESIAEEVRQSLR